jgi:hypothetical protein
VNDLGRWKRQVIICLGPFFLKNELLRMVEWGVVQSKFNKAMFQI